ncbi:MAG: UDP-N-acetylenolpyruvoylglucosamine reductase, partial [Gemmatimonadaceae bacterium]
MTSTSAPATPTTVAAFLDAARGSLAADRLHMSEVLAPYTTFRIGGPADVLYDATSADDLAEAVRIARQTETPHF